VGSVTAVQDSTGAPTWSMTLTRIAGSSSYGAYTVGWNQIGFDRTGSTIVATIMPVTISSGS
jgi:hypothetical protein